MAKQQITAQEKTQLTTRIIKVDDTFSTFLGYMPNPDEVLRDTGEAIGIYRQMQTDPRVKSLLRIAKGTVLGYPVRLEQDEASDTVYDICKQAIKKVPFYEIEKRLVSAITYGFAAVEVVWENQKGWWLPVDVVLRKPERFAFDVEGRLKYRTSYGELIDLYDYDYKWLVYRYDKDAENPYGTSALKSCYWPWKFKQAGAQFWVMAAEKFSVPSILALFESSEDEKSTKKRALELSELLATVQSGSGAALANIKEVIPLSIPGQMSEFQTLMEWCDTQIAYGIVYQTLAVQEAEYGSRAQAEVHQSTWLTAAKDVCREIAPVLQQLISWIVALNFGPGESEPQVHLDLKDYASWEDICNAIDRNIPVSQSALYDRYGLPEPADDADSFIKPSMSPSMGFGLADDTNKKKLPPRRPLTFLS